MSEITDRIVKYAETKDGWPELVNWLAHHRWPKAKRYADPQPGPNEQRDWDFDHVEGTWDEVEEAHWRGFLTQAEYAQIVEALQVAQPPPEPKGPHAGP